MTELSPNLHRAPRDAGAVLAQLRRDFKATSTALDDALLELDLLKQPDSEAYQRLQARIDSLEQQMTNLGKTIDELEFALKPLFPTTHA